MSATRSKRKQFPPARPGVVFDHNLTDGIDVIANAVRGTLGPTPRMVAVERMSRDHTPELMDDAGTLARRILQLPDPTTDAGAMLLRHALWRMRETHGDGAATLAMLAQAMAREATRALAAGGHPTLLRQGIEAAAKAAVEALHTRAVHVPGGTRGRAMLRGIASALCQDEDLRNALVEVIEIIGAEGGVQIMPQEAGGITREFAEGAMWDGGWITPGFATTPGKQLDRVEDVAVVAVHGKLDDAQRIISGLARIHAAGYQTVVLILDGLGETGKQVMLQAHHKGLIRILPLRITKSGAELMLAFQDVCVLSGATLIYGEDGELADAAFAEIDPAHIGKARRVWADDKRFGIIGGARDPQQVRAAIALIRRQLNSMSNTKTEEMQALRARLGRLNGGLGILRVGAMTVQAGEQRRDEAQRLARALQATLTSGVVAGGGAALARIGAGLKNGTSMPQGDVQRGCRIVANALSAPLAAIAGNAGHDASIVVGPVSTAKDAIVFDARSGALRDMVEAGIMDSVEMLCSAVQLAASVAAMAVTTDAVVLRRSPPTSANP